MELKRAKWEKFCQLYAISGNATQAYLEAYNCKYENANSSSADLIVKPSIKARIAEIKAEMMKKIEEKKNSKIMELEELLEFYSSVIRDEEERTETRLKAGRHLADIRGYITQNVNMQGEMVTMVEMVGDVDA